MKTFEFETDWDKILNEMYTRCLVQEGNAKYSKIGKTKITGHIHEPNEGR